MPEPARSCTAQVDGAAVHFWKSGTGPALVMLHGLIANGRSWEPSLPALAPLRTVYALDMPNMGRTERVPSLEAGLATTAEWVARFLEAVGIERADLVGSSHGGAVSLMLAARHPGRVRSLVLFAPANPFCERPRSLLRFYNSWLGGMFARSIPYLPAFAHQIAHKRAYGDPAKVHASTLAGYTEGLNGASIEHSLRIVHRWWQDMAELREALPAAAAVPTLLVWGDRDGIVGPESAEPLRRALGAELRFITGAGHLPFAEEPYAANRLMTGWLQSFS